MQIIGGKLSGLLPRKLRSIVVIVLGLVLVVPFVAACGTIPKTLTSDAATCAAIKRSPQYSGKALDKAGQKPLHDWTSTTNRTLDNLNCPRD